MKKRIPIISVLYLRSHILTILMIFVKSLALVAVFNFVAIVCKDVIDKENYMGSKFPVKYLVPEKVTPTMSDLNHYISSLRSTVGYFLRRPNSTDINTAAGLFYLKGKI